MYSMKDLSSRVKRSPQALYSLIKQNEALSSIVKENTTKDGRFIKYGEPVLQWLMDYYGITEPTVNEVETDIEETNEPKIPQDTAPDTPVSPSTDKELEYLKRENDLLRGQIEALTKDKEQQSNEISRLLLLLQEEKQEKMTLFLAAAPKVEPEPDVPRQTFVDKIKTLFKKQK